MLLPFVKTLKDGKLRRKYDAEEMENTNYPFLFNWIAKCPQHNGGPSL
jgi:hypothetical protein